MNSGSSRVVLITGASSGIGRATALLAAGRGDHLALLARGEGPLADVAQECEAAGATSVMALAANVARVVMRTIDRPKARVQVGAFNPLIIFGFSALPGLFDSLVTPLFEVAATDARQAVRSGTGNVFCSVADGNRLRGAQGNPVVSIVAGVRRKLRGRRH